MLQPGSQKGKMFQNFVLLIISSLFWWNLILAYIYLSRAAYVEFMRKEAADNALSLDGTSFMSRILKVLITAWHFSYLEVFPPNFCLFSSGIFFVNLFSEIIFHFGECQFL